MNSIEEVFLEIKKVFETLLSKGEHIKNVPTKEAFDTSLADIKIQDFLSFDFTMTTKPIFP